MLLTISYAGPDSTDLGFLLHKHPGRLQTFDLSVGKAHVFYPQSTDERCTAALMPEVDPISLVRNKRFGGSDSFSLGHYVNDRPYASSSMFAVAIGQVFRTAMTGRSDARPELAASALQARRPATPSCRSSSPSRSPSSSWSATYTGDTRSPTPATRSIEDSISRRMRDYASEQRPVGRS